MNPWRDESAFHLAFTHLVQYMDEIKSVRADISSDDGEADPLLSRLKAADAAISKRRSEKRKAHAEYLKNETKVLFTAHKYEILRLCNEIKHVLDLFLAHCAESSLSVFDGKNALILNPDHQRALLSLLQCSDAVIRCNGEVDQPVQNALRAACSLTRNFRTCGEYVSLALIYLDKLRELNEAFLEHCIQK
jgi:hypothetical protein